MAKQHRVNLNAFKLPGDLKNIREMWRNYLLQTYQPEQPPEDSQQYLQIQQAFYMGCMAILVSLVSQATDDRSEEEGARWIQRLLDEGKETITEASRVHMKN